MADSRYNRLDNQAPAQTQLKATDSPVGRSAHDWSCIHNGNAIIGALHVVDCFDVVPNEDIDISLAALLEFRNPTTRQLYNGFRVFFHAYYNRLTDLWEGARNWIDNGRSGKVQLTRPNLIYHVDSIQGSDYKCNACTPLSLLNDLGLPPEYIQDKVLADPATLRIPLRSFQSALYGHTNWTATKLSESVDFFPADCAMAYQRNWRDFYCNKNLLQNNKYWFPDNEHHFILSYSCVNAVCVNYEDEDLSSFASSHSQPVEFVQLVNLTDVHSFTETNRNSYTPEPNNPRTVAPVGGYTPYYAPNLCGLKFRQFRGDRFTTALPFPDLIRGDIPALAATMQGLSASFTGTSEQIYIDEAQVRHPDNQTWHTEKMYVNNYATSYGDYPYALSVNDSSSSFDSTSENPVRIPLAITPKGTVTINGTAAANITMSDIYTLETLTAFRRRMGMTNGDYNETIKAQFGVSPNLNDGKGTYIGGFYQDFSMSSVTQQSQSDTTPLGTKAGQGISSGSGTIGHFHTPDFGWIQIYMSIVPDVYYTQGKPRMFSKKSNLELYFPIFNNLPAQAILNKELFVSGNTVTDESPYAYEDRYAEYKSRPNRVSGFMGVSPTYAAYDASRIIARRFSSTPALNSSFVTMVPENIDMEPFAVTNEPPFDYSIGISCRRVFPGPYTAIEGSLSSPALN